MADQIKVAPVLDLQDDDETPEVQTHGNCFSLVSVAYK